MYDLMIVSSRLNSEGGVGMTSQIKSFPSRLAADYAVDAIKQQDRELVNHSLFAVKLYGEDHSVSYS